MNWKEPRKPTRKDNIVAAIIIAFFITIWLGALLLGPTQVNMPADVRPQTTPGKAIEVPRTPVPVEPAPSPVQKPQNDKIYVVATGIPSIWAIGGTLRDWNKATKYVDFVRVNACPVAEPCLTYKMETLPADTAGETRFLYSNQVEIALNKKITNAWVAHSTVCHETGHVLGLPHISGTVDTCMTAKDGFFRTRPSELDSRLVNSYGSWELEKMYELSGKDVDSRTLPR